MSDTEQTTMSQQLLPLAFVNGEALVERPVDLYIPPDALEVFLETFSGPLDLLLYLIRKQTLDIVDLPVFEITKQYMEYVSMMSDIQLELAAEYMLMAATLAEIKSRLLLPKPELEEDEDDPRAELIRRLKEYDIIKQAAVELDGLPRMGRDMYRAKAEPALNVAPEKNYPEINLKEIVLAFQDAIVRSEAFTHHQIEREQLSTRESMTLILALLKDKDFTPLSALFSADEGRSGCVVSFLAILELLKEGELECIQAQPYSDMHVRLNPNKAVYNED